MRVWSEAESYLIGEATADLEQGDDVRPCLVAFAGDEPQFVAFLRTFAKGAYADAVIELLALAGPLGSDRLALSMPARAWSLEDPIPRVVDGIGDLRKRVLSITIAEESHGRVGVRSVVVPFSRTNAGVVWEQPLGVDDAVGWIPSALGLAVEHRAAMRTSAHQMRRQARRCVALGHLLALSEPAAERLGMGSARQS